MKFLLQAAVILTVSANALVVPPVRFPSHDAADGYAVAGSIATDGTSAYFSVPCPGCFTDTTDELDLELKVESTRRSCESSGLTINGARLDNTPSTILFKANTSGGPNAYAIAAKVDQACLGNHVTLLTLHVNEVVGQPKVPPNTGFSVSFEQGTSPKFLRLEHSPISDTSNIENVSQWMQPHEDPDVVIVASSPLIDNKLPNQVQEELRRLHEIKARIGRLVHQHMKQERRILRLITEDFNACHGARCYFQTAIAKAPDLFELVKAHFKFRPDWSKLKGHQFHGFNNLHQIPELISPENPEEWNGKQSSVPTHHGDDIDKPPHLDDADFSQDNQHDELDSADFRPPLPPPPFDKEHPSHQHHEDHPPFSPAHDDGDGQSPPPPRPHEHHHHSPPPPPCHRHGRPTDHHDGHRLPRHCRSHFFHRHGPYRHPLFFSVGTLVFIVIVASLLFKCLKAKTGLFRSNRRRRDCAARREECRTRIAYRRAAMRHKWRQWWSQFRRPESTADYEEKRARLLNQEDALEDVMQGEIRELRRAHEIVGDMRRAEEGRQRLYHEANFGSSSASSSFTPGISRQYTQNSQTTESTLPLYQPPPPSYDQELEGEMTVVDGFLYTPSVSDNTPDSSVIDCNSRMSFDTDTTVTK